MGAREDIRAQLTGAGGPFEIVEETVRGERMQVFKNRTRSLRELLANSALHGDKEYMVHGDRRITYGQHARLVASVAKALCEKYGVGKGDRVAILAANSPDWVIAFWAATSLGAIVTALNGWWAAEEIRYGIEHTTPKLLIGDRKRLERARDLDIPVIEIESRFEELLGYDPEAALPDTDIAEDDPALILFTSGTTGRPKAPLVSHRALCGFVQINTMAGLERIMLANAEGTARPDPNPPSPCALVTAPLFHLSGLYAMAIMMLATGAKTVYRSGRFVPEDVLRLIEEEQITIWTALGNTGRRLLQDPAIGKVDVSSIRNIGFGGAPTSPDLQAKLREAFPNAKGNLGMGYGLSESGGLGATIGGRELEENPTSTGRAYPTHQIEIRDDDGKALPDGEEGEIHIRSPYLMLEYYGDPEATSGCLLPGNWLATGDVGFLRDGLLYINSRARDLILRGAENVSPVEIEHRLDAHPSVAESAVVGVDHPELGQEVKAIVVAAPGASIDTDALAAWVGETLAAFKVPALFEVRSEALPRNAAGKVLKNVLTGERTNDLIEE